MDIDSTASRLAAQGVAYPAQIAHAAQRHDLDPDLLAAVAAQETGGPRSNAGRNVVGDAGHGHGLFQIDDRSHAFASTPAAMDPEQNADYAAGMLSQLVAANHGDVRAALSAYNTGSPTAPGSATTWADGQRLDYADSVMRHYAQLTDSAAPAVASATPAAAQTADSPLETAVAEQGTVQSSIGALASQAMSVPLTPPTIGSGMAQVQQQYRPGSTDYMGFANNGDDGE